MRQLNSLLFSGALILACPSVVFAQGDHYVSGYYKSNGTYVRGHHATNPDETRNNNYSTRGNVNPYTGTVGTKPRDEDYSSGSSYSGNYIGSSYGGRTQNRTWRNVVGAVGDALLVGSGHAPEYGPRMQRIQAANSVAPTVYTSTTEGSYAANSPSQRSSGNFQSVQYDPNAYLEGAQAAQQLDQIRNRNMAYYALSNDQPEKAVKYLYAAGDIDQAEALEDRLAVSQGQQSQAAVKVTRVSAPTSNDSHPITIDGVVYTPYAPQ